MKLIKTKDAEGYDYNEIVKLHPEFKEWFVGQTGQIFEGKFIVYKWDYDGFLEGLPVND
jgi:hypothetical protein